MDVIELFCEDPIVFCIIDFEAAVLRNAGLVSSGSLGSEVRPGQHTMEAGLGSDPCQGLELMETDLLFTPC